ncbi:hypothetical protein ACP4OV_023177 [Aristida adscensionis]
MPLLLVALLGKVAGARHTVPALRTAEISIGVVLLAAALGLIFFKPPGGVFLRLPGRAPAIVYYGILGVAAVFGFVEASIGFWVVPRDMDGDWRATVGEVVLWFSLFFLALVAALGGLSFRN